MLEGSRLGSIVLALAGRFRRRRMERFCRALGITAETRVLDVGGTPAIWSVAPVRPRVVVVNRADVAKEPDIPFVRADARRLPFRDGAFPVVFSNSVMEHVGSLDDQRAYAEEVDRVGRRYFVQTGNRRFPVEMHFLTPFIHWLPRPWQRRLIRNFTLWGLLVRPSEEEAQALLEEVRLPTVDEMRACFPDAVLRYERVLGMKKSLIAVKR
jgi:SAM-dependent methyltransferase